MKKRITLSFALVPRKRMCSLSIFTSIYSLISHDYLIHLALCDRPFNPFMGGAYFVASYPLGLAFDTFL